MSGAARLSIDFGTTHTVAVVRTADGNPSPLLFDASPLLLSAVCAERSGNLLTGRDAERVAPHVPGRFEPNPKLRIDEGRILLDEDEFDIEDLIAATLRRVAAEAAHRLGGPVGDGETVLTHPASWAAPRREVLRRAAERAGLGAVRLVPEPVAAATFYARHLDDTANDRALPPWHGVPTGPALAPGSLLAVYDLGGGTFDVTIVRWIADGWAIVATGGLDDVGGLDLDASIVDHLGRTVGGRDPRRWRRLLAPTDHPGRRQLRAFHHDLRGAKEQLSRTTSTVIRVPGLEVETHLSREEFEAIAAPWLNRTVDRVADVLHGAGLAPERLAAIVLVGGSSRIPLVATLLHRRFGIAPTLVEQPELVVAQGGLDVQPEPESPPAGAPAAAGAPAPAGATATGPGRGGAQPSMSGAAASRPSAPPPSDRAARSGPHRQGPRRLAATIGVAVMLVAAGLVGAKLAGADTSGWPGFGRGPGSTSDAPNPGVAQRVDVNKTAWFGGFQVTFGTASYEPPRDSDGARLTVDIKVRNLGTEDRDLYRSDLPVTATFDGRATEGGYPSPTVKIGAGSEVEARAVFDLAQPVRTLAAGVLTLGEDDDLLARIPIGAGDLVALKPVPLLADQSAAIAGLTVDHLSCELRGDNIGAKTQVRTGTIAVSCTYNVAYRGTGSNVRTDDEDFRLIMPNGDPRAPARVSSYYIYPDEEKRGEFAVFEVPWPAPGSYRLRMRGGDNKTTTDFPLTLPGT